MNSRRTFFSFLLLFSLVVPARRPKECSVSLPEGVLPNGLTVLMIPMPSRASCRTSRSYAPAAATRSSRALGLRALLRAHDVPRHEEESGPVYDRIVASLGAQANANTSDDLTASTSRSPRKTWSGSSRSKATGSKT